MKSKSVSALMLITLCSMLIVQSAIADEMMSKVSRAVFSNGVSDHEPIDQLETNIDNSVSPIYFFTELTNMSGQTVTHRWFYNGTEMADVKISVGGDRWRAYSTKNMLPMWIGTWSVAVIDDQGNEIMRKSFDYNKGAVATDMGQTEETVSSASIE